MKTGITYMWSQRVTFTHQHTTFSPTPNSFLYPCRQEHFEQISYLPLPDSNYKHKRIILTSMVHITPASHVRENQFLIRTKPYRVLIQPHLHIQFAALAPHHTFTAITCLTLLHPKPAGKTHWIAHAIQGWIAIWVLTQLNFGPSHLTFSFLIMLIQTNQFCLVFCRHLKISSKRSPKSIFEEGQTSRECNVKQAVSDSKGGSATRRKLTKRTEKWHRLSVPHVELVARPCHMCSSGTAVPPLPQCGPTLNTEVFRTFGRRVSFSQVFFVVAFFFFSIPL